MKTIARLLEETFGPPLRVKPPVEAPAHHRRKLWELPAAWHCPLVGTCLTVADLRQLAKRAGVDDASVERDYSLHSIVVDHCGHRNKISELLQRFFDERHALSIQRFSRVKGGDAVLALWRKALADGDIVGSLWAAWTHADIVDSDGSIIYGELHMRSHQLGAQERAEQKRLLVLEQENVRLRDEATVLRQNLAAAQRERERCIGALGERLVESERQAARFARDEITLATASRTEMVNSSLRERNAALGQRLAALEQRNAVHISRVVELENELAHTRNALKKTGSAPAATAVPEATPAGAAGCLPERPADIRLAGCRVLCVGGRTGMIDHYRRLVEASGGHFLHHDGGQEENEHRIDAIVAGADAVVCQIGHVSHPAYWRIKNACKQRGLPCLFLKSGGITTFARNLGTLAEEYVGACPPMRHDHFFDKEKSVSP